MKISKSGKYLKNCFVLLIPVFMWNIVFMKSLPKGYTMEIFWEDIPAVIGYTENVLRILVFALPIIMTFSLGTNLQKFSLGLYISGIILYFLSWTVQIYFPDLLWSKSILGFLAPAYTTLIWFVGIGLIGKNSFLKIPFMSEIYISLSAVFVLFHTIHCYIVFRRL